MGLAHLFNCQFCGRAQPRRTKVHRVVVETRERIYPKRARADTIRRPEQGKRSRVVLIDDPGGRGREIVREAAACATCAAARQAP